MTRRMAWWFGLVVTTLPLLAGPALADPAAGDGRMRGASPAAASTPGARDPASGAKEVGVGRATGSVKSSGDEGGTAAGMPNRGPAPGTEDRPAAGLADRPVLRPGSDDQGRK